jgi:hypothetical protein
MPLLSYAVHLVLLILVPLSSLPCYLYDAILILTSDIQREMDVQIFLKTLDTEESFDTMALIDSGCMTTSISDRFV